MSMELAAALGNDGSVSVWSKEDLEERQNRPVKLVNWIINLLIQCRTGEGTVFVYN